MRICVTGGNGMVGSCIKDITNQYPEHEFVFLHRNIGRHGVELTSQMAVLTYFSSEKYDAIIICTAHDNLNKKELYKKSKLIFDTRGIYKDYSSKKIIQL